MKTAELILWKACAAVGVLIIVALIVRLAVWGHLE